MSIRLLVSLILYLLVDIAAAAPIDPKTGLALALMDVMHLDAMMKNTQDQLTSMFQSQYVSSAGCAATQPIIKELSTKVSEKVLSTLGSDDFKVDVAAVYSEVFSQVELQQMIDFYRTPLGQKMLVHMPELMQKSMLLTQERMKVLQPQITALTSGYDQRIRDATASCSAGATGEMKK